MTTQVDANTTSSRKLSALAEKRADALRANLKRRKGKSAAREISEADTGSGVLNMNETR